MQAEREGGKGTVACQIGMNPSKITLMKPLNYILSLLVLFVLCMADAYGAMTSPQNPYRAPTAAEVSAIKSTGFWQNYAARDEAILRIFSDKFDGTKYVLVRMESAYCDGVKCMTGIFKGRIAGETLSAAGALPPFVSRGDKGRKMCDDCKPIFPLVFLSSSEMHSRDKQIWLWRYGVFF